jgi:FkbM family methyltransferase
MSFLNNINKGIEQRIKKFRLNPYKSINLNWFKIKYYKHLPAGEVKIHKLFSKQLYFSDSVQLVSGLTEIFIEQLYNQELHNNEPYIIDCGANIGLSIIYVKEKFPNAKILAFEPDDTNYFLLSKNIASFEYKNVELRKQAVWIEDTVLNFSSDASMSSKISESSSNNSISVNAIRLKDFLKEPVDFLKIDIEGAEYSVLNDIAEQLHFVRNLFIEYHGTFNQNGELLEMLNIVKQQGFQFYIKEAASLFDFPFIQNKKSDIEYDIQLNIFCFRTIVN